MFWKNRQGFRKRKIMYDQEKMNINSIKPLKENVDYHEQAQKEYSEYFIDPKSNLVKDSFLEKRRCPVCSQNSSKPFFVKDGLSFGSCNHCSMVYINNYILSDEKEKYYKNSLAFSSFFENIVLKTREKRIDVIWKDRISLFEKYWIDGNVLDVGCGTGEFLECLNDKGHNTLMGIEPNQFAAEYANTRLPGKIVHDIFENVDLPDDYFDLVTLWEVLSHFNDPKLVLKKVFKSMKDGGHIIISSPNFMGFEYQVLLEWHNDVTFKIPNYFSIKTLPMLLKKIGFTIINSYTPGRLDVQHVLRNTNLYKDKIRLDPFVENIICDDSPAGDKVREEFQKFLSNNSLSGNMLIIAKR